MYSSHISIYEAFNSFSEENIFLLRVEKARTHQLNWGKKVINSKLYAHTPSFIGKRFKRKSFSVRNFFNQIAANRKFDGWNIYHVSVSNWRDEIEREERNNFPGSSPVLDKLLNRHLWLKVHCYRNEWLQSGFRWQISIKRLDSLYLG